jgi:hypothetical protein
MLESCWRAGSLRSYVVRPPAPLMSIGGNNDGIGKSVHTETAKLLMLKA